MNLETIKLFLKWFFIPYGVTKVHPAMGFKYLPGLPPGTAETIVESKLTRFLKEQECVICKVRCWARNKKAPPICTTWPCYKSYYSKPKTSYTTLTKEVLLKDLEKLDKEKKDD